MRRFALFCVALVILVIVGLQPSKGGVSAKRSMCVCLPTRAALLLKSMTNNVAANTTKLIPTKAACPSSRAALVKGA